MTLTDTSGLVRHYRNPTPHRERLIQTMAPVVCGLTVAEMLMGARTPAQVVGTQAVLGLFGRLPIPESTWEVAGRNQAHWQGAA